jgi:hypothetical protein
LKHVGTWLLESFGEHQKVTVHLITGLLGVPRGRML